MSGHVFHPGHHALHGITVVLETRGSRIYVGRFDSEDAGGVHLLDVAVHEGAQGGGPSRDEFLRRTAKFGVRAEHPRVTVPAADVAAIRRLSEVETG